MDLITPSSSSLSTGHALVWTAVAATFAGLLWGLHPRLTLIECAAAAPAVGLSVSAWLALLLKGSETLSAAIVGRIVDVQALAFVVFAWGAFKSLHRHRLAASHELYRHRAAIVVFLAMGFWWAHQSRIHYLDPQGQNRPKLRGGASSVHMVSGAVYADLPFHLNVVTSFLGGCNSDAAVGSALRSSFFAGETLAYPFLPDFYIAVIVAGGCSLHQALALTATVLLTSMMVLLYLFAFRLSGSRRAGVGAAFLTLFAGGIEGIKWAMRTPDWTERVFTRAFGFGPDWVLHYDLTTTPAKMCYWFSLPAHILFPQRTVQHAYPLVLVVLLLIHKAVRGRDTTSPFKLKAQKKGHARVTASSGKGGGRNGQVDGAGEVEAAFEEPPSLHTAGKDLQLYSAAGIVTGLLPLMQPHSFISVGVVVLVVAALQVVTMAATGHTARSGAGLVRQIGSWVMYGVWSFGLGLPQFVRYFFGRVSDAQAKGGKGFVRFSPVWVEDNNGEGPMQLWWRSLGLFLPIYIVGLAATAVAAAAAAFSARSTVVPAPGPPKSSAIGDDDNGGGVSNSGPTTRNRKRKAATSDVAKKPGGRSNGGASIEDGESRLTKQLSDEEQQGQQRVLPPAAVRLYFDAGFAVLFVVCNLVMFQPWHLDNTKLFYVWMFGASACLCSVLVAAIDGAQRIGGRAAGAGASVAIAVAYASLVFSGMLACWREEMNRTSLYDEADFAVAGWIAEHTPADSVFLNAPGRVGSHVAIESSLAGRQVAYGYEGWLHSHGIDYGRRRDFVEAVKGAKGDAVAGFRRHSVGWVLTRQRSTDAKQHFDFELLNEVADPVATDGTNTVWKVLDSIANFTVRDCGYHGITPAQCRDKGCWYHEFASTAWCIHKPYEVKNRVCRVGGSDDKTLNAEGGKGGDSGGGVVVNDQKTCREVGCLWYQERPKNKCLKPRWQLAGGVPPVVIRSPMRAKNHFANDCGYPSITKNMCIARGCRWIPNNKGPWCVLDDGAVGGRERGEGQGKPGKLNNKASVKADGRRKEQREK